MLDPLADAKNALVVLRDQYIYAFLPLFLMPHLLRRIGAEWIPVIPGGSGQVLLCHGMLTWCGWSHSLPGGSSLLSVNGFEGVAIESRVLKGRGVVCFGDPGCV